MRMSYPVLAISLACFTGWLIGTNDSPIVLAQKSTSKSAAKEGTPKVLPRPDFKFRGKVGKTYKDSDPPEFPQPIQAPAGAPNIVLIMLDDTGFGQYSTFGGGIPSPTLDKLAAEGLRYNRFHTTALCSPTRAALITGRNHHSAATGVITEAATGYDGYTCVLPRSCGTIGEVLRQNGYMTAWIGKNHNTPAWETSAAGPFDRWANGLGFDYFYGFNAGDMDHWNPILYENRNLVPKSPDPDYHLTADLADKAIAMDAESHQHRPRQAVFSLCRAGRQSFAASRAARVDRQVQRPVRRRLGRLPRGDHRAAEAAWRDSRGHAIDGPQRGASRLGLAE